MYTYAHMINTCVRARMNKCMHYLCTYVQKKHTCTDAWWHTCTHTYMMHAYIRAYLRTKIPINTSIQTHVQTIHTQTCISIQWETCQMIACKETSQIRRWTLLSTGTTHLLLQWLCHHACQYLGQIVSRAAYSARHAATRSAAEGCTPAISRRMQSHSIIRFLVDLANKG